MGPLLAAPTKGDRRPFGISTYGPFADFDPPQSFALKI
jgi:hypothetical protein